MKRIAQCVLVFFLVLWAYGCVNTRCIRYETSARSPKPSDFPIEILDGTNIGKPYKVIGVVEANAGKLHSPTDTINHLKREARAMGGDALLNIQHGSGGGMVVPAGTIYMYGNLREIWTAKVIVWKKTTDQ
ncbi:MAG: hypothetical protein JRF60_07965 [Deltaproteobacteria bacterium]|nr:hypothetical protein [Deltaproteobacteria bacterium]MBW2250553.1 hypothetical protein [Deltaproteobacteria bacterium]